MKFINYFQDKNLFGLILQYLDCNDFINICQFKSVNEYYIKNKWCNTYKNKQLIKHPKYYKNNNNLFIPCPRCFSVYNTYPNCYYDSKTNLHIPSILTRKNDELNCYYDNITNKHKPISFGQICFCGAIRTPPLVIKPCTYIDWFNSELCYST